MADGNHTECPLFVWKETHKRCCSCKEVKERSEFVMNRAAGDGLKESCKSCVSAFKKRRRKAIRASAKEWAAEQRRAKAHRLRSNFKMTLEQYEAMCDAQHGLCAICGKPETVVPKNGSPWSLAVDHDHITGKVRGLLCTRCNPLLGYANDNVDILAKAIAYLQRYQS